MLLELGTKALLVILQQNPLLKPYLRILVPGFLECFDVKSHKLTAVRPETRKPEPDTDLGLDLLNRKSRLSIAVPIEH